MNLWLSFFSFLTSCHINKVFFKCYILNIFHFLYCFDKWFTFPNPWCFLYPGKYEKNKHFVFVTKKARLFQPIILSICEYFFVKKPNCYESEGKVWKTGYKNAWGQHFNFDIPNQASYWTNKCKNLTKFKDWSSNLFIWCWECFYNHFQNLKLHKILHFEMNSN